MWTTWLCVIVSHNYVYLKEKSDIQISSNTHIHTHTRMHTQAHTHTHTHTHTRMYTHAQHN